MGLRSTWVWAAVALAALVSGCETTTLRSAWFDTEFTGPPMRKKPPKSPSACWKLLPHSGTARLARPTLLL